ncbi:18249_t:CDS:2 [Funneliformis geosporum]|nr:18249_t:CDS:2 [Funneliformis geosporum]
MFRWALNDEEKMHKSREYQKQRSITQRLEGAMINNNARKQARINTLIGGLNTAREFQDKAAIKIGKIRSGVATDTDIILDGTWDEDWSIASGEPVNNASVISNTRGGHLAVTIASSIKLSQLLYLFRAAYITVEYLKYMAIFGQLMQDYQISGEQIGQSIQLRPFIPNFDLNSLNSNIKEHLLGPEFQLGYKGDVFLDWISAWAMKGRLPGFGFQLGL